MNNKKVLILLAILLLAGGGIFFLPSDEKKIRRNLDSFAGYCSTIEKEPAIESLKKAALAAKLCRNPSLVEVESFHIDRDFNRKDISDHLLLMKKKLTNTQFTFHDTVIEFPEEGARAEVVTTLRLKGGKKDRRFTDAYEIYIGVEKIEGDWLFSSFSVIEFLEQ